MPGREAEGKLKAVLSALDTIADEGKDHTKPAWHPSGVLEKDLQSTMTHCFLQKWASLQCCVQQQKADHRQVAEQPLQGQAWLQTWQTLPREQKEPVAVLRELREKEMAGLRSRSSQGQGLVVQHAGPGQAASENSQNGPSPKTLMEFAGGRVRPEQSPLPLEQWSSLGSNTTFRFLLSSDEDSWTASCYSGNQAPPWFLLLWVGVITIHPLSPPHKPTYTAGS